jgi:hypothetical protein
MNANPVLNQLFGLRHTSLMILLLGLVCISGCQRGVEQKTLAPLPSGERAVRLMILQGADGTTLALVPVYLNGEGPFAFALDTGASHSVVDSDLAEKLKLPVAGHTVKTTGVAAITRATPVLVENWRVGEVELPPRTLVTLDMPDTNEQYALQGLLGSDVLSLYGTVQIDYRGAVLILHPRDDENQGKPR